MCMYITKRLRKTEQRNLNPTYSLTGSGSSKEQSSDLHRRKVSPCLEIHHRISTFFSPLLTQCRHLPPQTSSRPKQRRPLPLRRLHRLAAILVLHLCWNREVLSVERRWQWDILSGWAVCGSPSPRPQAQTSDAGSHKTFSSHRLLQQTMTVCYKQDTVTQMAFFCSELMAALMCVLILARLPPCTTVEKRCEYSCSSLLK